MITAGIDAGNKTTKALIIKDGKIITRVQVPSGFDHKEASRNAFDEALRISALSEDEVNYITATGAGQSEVKYAHGRLTEVGAAARGAVKIFPAARTVIDVGAEEARALNIDENGKVRDFAVNDKCAAGTGSFVEAMSRTLDISVEEMGNISLEAQRTVTMNSQCAVFAESEVVSLIHSRVPVADIAKSIHEAVASRIVSLVRRIGLQKEIVLIGGLAYNRGFVEALEEALGIKLLVPGQYPEYISALGAALSAADKARVK